MPGRMSGTYTNSPHYSDVQGKQGNGSPVHFSSIEQYISDTYLDRMEISKVEKKNKKVAVIGAVPAGMTVAILLAQQGYGVTIFEWKDKIGGIMQYGIPEFRLPKTVVHAVAGARKTAESMMRYMEAMEGEDS